MARSRNIKPGFFKNELLVELPFETRLLFIGLWTIADREGRLEDRVTRIRMEIFPADAVDVEGGLQALHDRGFILRYAIDGVHYIQILAWAKHQNPHHKEVPSVIPAPHMPEALGSCMGTKPEACMGMDDNKTSDKPEAPSPMHEHQTVLIPDSFNLIPDSRALAQPAERMFIERFWPAYPRKVGKADASKAFVKLKPDEGLFAVMLDALRRQAASEQWRRDPQFIPHPATWLNGRRWEDDIDAPPAGRLHDDSVPDYLAEVL